MATDSKFKLPDVPMKVEEKIVPNEFTAKSLAAANAKNPPPPGMTGRASPRCIPSNWDIQLHESGVGIRATCSLTRESFEGTQTEFNDFIRGG